MFIAQGIVVPALLTVVQGVHLDRDIKIIHDTAVLRRVFFGIGSPVIGRVILRGRVLFLFLIADGQVNAQRIHGRGRYILTHGISIGKLAHHHDLFGVEFRSEADRRREIGGVAYYIIYSQGDKRLEPVAWAQQVIENGRIEQVVGPGCCLADQYAVIGAVTETQAQIRAYGKAVGDILIGRSRKGTV